MPPVPPRLIAHLVAGLTVAAMPASAAASFVCNACVFDPTEQQFYDFDYTVPPDGRTYRWTIDFTSADPLASLSLAEPNQTETFLFSRDDLGFIEDLNPPYRFDQSFEPGRTTIIVRAPRDFDFCAEPGPDDEFCRKVVHIWGNGTFITAVGNAPIIATFSESLVPEPASWALMIAGFSLVGATARHRRTHAYMKL